VKLRDAFDSPERKQQYVRRLFATIADRYDLITVLLSFGRDKRWKQRLVREANLTSGMRALDVACGTGDIAFELARTGGSVVGLDVTRRMIELAAAKRALDDTNSGSSRPSFIVGDMMALPFTNGSVDVVSTGYGLRNVPELDHAITEIARVLKPGGRLLSLDFNRPRSPIVQRAFLAYLALVGSAVGWILHRDADTYRYIPESLRRYPDAAGVAAILRTRGFVEVRIVPLLGGLMTLHVAKRQENVRRLTDS
jgi:ubiquinone/menaquinone biosynthesis methyltransferase